MATNNIINVGLSGQSGTGAFAGTNSPIFTTPTLGAALATSVNFGGSTLDNYIQSASFLPGFTCATPGDLSIVYTQQIGIHSRIGNIEEIYIVLNLTPTFTTASGSIRITNLPAACTNSVIGVYIGTSQGINYPAGTTYLSTSSGIGSTILNLRASGTGITSAVLNMTNIVSGAPIQLGIAGSYLA